MQGLSGTHKCLWAFAYVATAGVSVYGTMRVMDADPKSMLASWQSRSDQSPTSILKSAASAPLEKTEAENIQVRNPDSKGGSFNTSAAGENECKFSPDEVKYRKEMYLEAIRGESRFNYSTLTELYSHLKRCPDRLNVLGLDKKQFASGLRQAAINELQGIYRSYLDNGMPVWFIGDMFEKAAYAGVSDDGVLNIEAGLRAAHLPDEKTLRAKEASAQLENLRSDINKIRAYSNSGSDERLDVSISVDAIKSLIEKDSALASSLGISVDELNRVEERVQADEKQFNEQTPVSSPEPN